MTLEKYTVRFLCAILIAAVLAGCAARGHRAPVQERGAKKSNAAAATKSASRDKDWRPQVYVVQKGDTLYSIAFNHGLDYHEIAELNNIQNPSLISIGQELRLFPSGSAASPTSEAPRVVESKPLESSTPQEPPIKDQPITMKLVYSAQVVAQIEKMQKSGSVTAARADIKSDSKLDVAVDNADDEDEGALTWSMPTIGKVVGEFSESANRKGIDIAGKSGQPVIASAAGKVVYSGNGLRGYGKLVIVKHNKTYLSAYAHNDKVLVKEGQSVSKGQKIAEMGKTDADQVKLHFEIRKLGKPVDPAKYLPL